MSDLRNLIFFSFFLLSILFFFSNCKGGKAPVSDVVEQTAQLSGEIQGADLTGGPFDVVLVDANGTEVTSFKTAEDGSFTETLPPEVSDGDFVLIAKREGKDRLEKVVRVRRGKISRAEISDISTLIAFLSRALFSKEADSDNADALEGFIRERFDAADIQAAVSEIRGESTARVVIQMLEQTIRDYHPASVD